MNTKICFGCEHYSELDGGRFKCVGDIRCMEIVCLFKRFLWRQEAMAPLAKKMEKLVDEQSDDKKSGDEWKK